MPKQGTDTKVLEIELNLVIILKVKVDVKGRKVPKWVPC